MLPSGSVIGAIMQPTIALKNPLTLHHILDVPGMSCLVEDTIEHRLEIKRRIPAVTI